MKSEELRDFRLIGVRGGFEQLTHAAMRPVKGKESSEFTDWVAVIIDPEVDVRLVSVTQQRPRTSQDESGRLASAGIPTGCSKSGDKTFGQWSVARLERPDHPLGRVGQLRGVDLCTHGVTRRVPGVGLAALPCVHGDLPGSVDGSDLDVVAAVRRKRRLGAFP